MFISTADFDGEAVFRLNARNTMSLIYEGYTFHKHRVAKNGANYWVCHKRTDKDYRCRARAWTIQVGKKYMVKVINDTHMHAPDSTFDQ